MSISDNDSFKFDYFINKIISLNGKFQGKLKWCSDLNSNTWKVHFLQITQEGSLSHLTDIETHNNKDLISNLQNCKLKIIDNNSLFYIIQVTSNDGIIVFLQTLNKLKFSDLFCSLIWWSNLRTAGIFNKMTFLQNNSLLSSSSALPKEVLSCELIVYDQLATLGYSVSRYNASTFMNNNTTNLTSFPATVVLKSNGDLDIRSPDNKSLICSGNIITLLRSEIKIF